MSPEVEQFYSNGTEGDLMSQFLIKIKFVNSKNIYLKRESITILISFLNGPFPASFSLFLSFQRSSVNNMFVINFCRWLVSNHEPLPACQLSHNRIILSFGIIFFVYFWSFQYCTQQSNEYSVYDSALQQIRMLKMERSLKLCLKFLWGIGLCSILRFVYLTTRLIPSKHPQSWLNYILSVL